MAFLTEELIEEISSEKSAGGRYINPAKIDGEITVRFVGDMITGFEGWTTDNKPRRWAKKPGEVPENIKASDSGAPGLKRFLAGIVWDYEASEFKCMLITQKTLIEKLIEYNKMPRYGDPTCLKKGYDIAIKREGSGKDTKYSLTALPPEPLNDDVKEAYTKEFEKHNIHALYEGGEVFG